MTEARISNITPVELLLDCIREQSQLNKLRGD
jgi:hypothetical protein